MLEYDPNVIPATNVSDVLAAHGYVLRATEAETEAGAGWADRLASMVKDWVINALVDRLALAMISALA